jgi:iron complex transport system substrate-binding protein
LFLRLLVVCASGASRHFFGLVTTVVVLGAACADPGSRAASDRASLDSAVVVVDDTGREVRLSRPARRVVALLPALTESIVELGAGELLVARTDHDAGLGVDHLPSVGGGLTPSLEALTSHRPDLVLAWEEAGGPRVRPRLEELGVAVFAVQTRDTASVFRNITTLGTLLGRDAEARELAARLRSELDAVRRSVSGLHRPSVLLVISVDPPMIAGSELFMTELIEVAGGRSAFPELRHSPQVSIEEIVRRRPELVILPTSRESSRSIERLRQTPGWSELLAHPGVRIQTVPVDVVSRPGPSIAAAARIFRDIIHPDVAELAGGAADP